jgi:hypothetical protein
MLSKHSSTRGAASRRIAFGEQETVDAARSERGHAQSGADGAVDPARNRYDAAAAPELDDQVTEAGLNPLPLLFRVELERLVESGAGACGHEEEAIPASW